MSEHDAMERKYQNSKETMSVILEGPAIGYIRDKKKRAGVSGSRGKYISHCIVFYETHIPKILELESLIREKDSEIRDLKYGQPQMPSNEIFMLETRIQHLEKLLRENGIIY